MSRSIILATLVVALPSLASAHVMFTSTTAQPGANYSGALRISHGCDGSATTALRVEIPDSVSSAKPQAKAGWNIAIERKPLAQPIKGEGGKTVTERVSAITWTAKGGEDLPDDEFDDFGLMLKLPKTEGPVYFPARQTCQAGANAWSDIPAAGQAWHDVKHPAPVLNLSKDDMSGMAMPGMDMSHMDHSGN